jgi:hypothetical protein
MSCNAVLITQFNFPDFEAPTQLCLDGIYVNDVLTEIHRIDLKFLYQIAVLHQNAS